MFRLNLTYDLLQKAKISSNTSNEKRDRHIDQISFVICNSCYGCATYFRTDSLSSSSSVPSPICHSCNSHNIELMPILTDESFRIKYNPIRGMETEICK